MNNKKALVLLTFVIVDTESKINPSGPTVVLDFTNCINSLIDINFNEPGVLIFANSNNVSTSVTRVRTELLKKINEKIQFTVQVMSPEQEVDICDNYDETLGILHVDNFEPIPIAAYFIIVVDSYEDFPYLASKLLRSRSWNPRAKFIILLLKFSNEETNVDLVERMLSCLFKYNVINAMMLVPQANSIRNALIYSWQPLDPPKYCGYFNETAKNRLYVENICIKGTLQFDRISTSGQIPDDMKGCVLQIIALEKEPFVSKDENEPNIEKNLIKELASTFNFKTNFKIINSFRGERVSKGKWTGALRKLTSKMGQLLLGGIFPDFDVHEDFECSMSYLADSYTWVVPRAYHSPPWIALSITFKESVWYSVIATFGVCALSWRLIGHFSRDTEYNRTLRHCFLNAWICTLGFCAYIRPKTNSLRLFFCFFNIYCVVFVTAYQTKLIDVLKNPTFEFQTDDVEELVESGLAFGGPEELHDLFSNSTDYFDDLIYSKWILVEDMATAIVNVAVHRNFSVLTSRLELAHITASKSELSDALGNYKYFPFQLNMFSVPMEMVAMRGFPFMQKFSSKLSLFKECGINEAARRKFSNFNEHRRGKLLRSLLKKYNINSLSFQHLQGGFTVLAFGYTSGFLVLMVEIIVNTDFVKRKLDKYLKRK